MSVFTQLDDKATAVWLEAYRLGRLDSIEGIAEGVQNSNFFLGTAKGEYVLTLFEEATGEQIAFYVRLMLHLAGRGIVCPVPVANSRGEFLGELEGRPAAVFTRLPGISRRLPTPQQCAAVGALLGRLHVAASSFPEYRPHPRNLDWCVRAAERIMPCLEQGESQLLGDEISHQQASRPTSLPRGIIHADLFRDNVLFVAGEVSGVLDFYFAGTDDLLFDLAVTVNDWCLAADGSLDSERTVALVSAYHRYRPLVASERAAWSTLLRAAALRFWVSRLVDRHRPRAGDLVIRRDPDCFRAILEARIANAGRAPWPAEVAPDHCR